MTGSLLFSGMIYMVYIALGYLAFTSLIFWMNVKDFKSLPRSKPATSREMPRVSICIPARNEEAVIERSVHSAMEQNYPAIEVIVLDDESTDTTPNILNKLKNYNLEKLYVIKGKKRPANWIGKPWACHQLSKKASGDVLIFIDADTWLEPETSSRIVQSMTQHQVDFITVWPMQKLGTFWEKIVIPIVYYGLLTLLPTRYVHHKPKWLPRSLGKRFSSSFAAACGQCMAFTRKAYDAIGGHASVKSKIVEDVALAKQIKRNGFRMRMHHGDHAIHCRMYRSETEMWDGFRKNFLALYNNSIIAFILMAAINLIVYVVPFILLAVAAVTTQPFLLSLSIIAIVTIIVHRLLLAYWYNWSYIYSITHPLGVLWFLKLGVRVLKDYFLGISPRWKGRPIDQTKSR